MFIHQITLSAAAVLALAACAAGMDVLPAARFSQAGLPPAVQVPAGHRVALETVGTGQITYKCLAKKDAAGQHEWVLVGPVAQLTDRKGNKVGTYHGPPATWVSRDGSWLTGTQVAAADATAGSIPLQLVQVQDAMGQGVMRGITFIQRVDTRGGAAPSASCGAGRAGHREAVKYQAGYIFWKAA